jgi:hypothetical protein
MILNKFIFSESIRKELPEREIHEHLELQAKNTIQCDIGQFASAVPSGIGPAK